MRRKLLCVSCAMIFGIWCAGINVILAVSLALAAFLYGKVLYKNPHRAHMGKTECSNDIQSAGRNDVNSDRITGSNHFHDMRTLALACAVAMLVGAVRMELQTWYYDAYLLTENENMIKAEVIKVSQKKGKSPKLTVKVLDIDYSGQKNSSNSNSPKSIDLFNYKCLVTWNGGKEKDDLWQLTGSVIEFRGVLGKPDGAANPRCFDYRTYLRSQGISCSSSAKTIRIVKKNGSPVGVIRRKIIGFREGFIHALCNDNSGKTEALLRGVLFGDTDSMDEDMEEDFRNNGTAHVLAVSALHVGLLYSIFRALRKKFALPGMTAVFLAVLGIYGTMTLWTVSVTRAAALILMMEAGDRLDRRFDLLTSLGFVSMLVLIRNPYALYGTSFIMSYLAALSIGIICPALERHVPDWLPANIKTSLSVQLGLYPYIAYTFNLISLGVVIINIPVVALLSVIVTVAAAAVPVYALSNLAGSLLLQPFARILELISNIMILLNERFSEIDILSPDVVSPPLFFVAMYYALIFIICSESFRIARLRKDYRMIAPQIGVAAIAVLMSVALSVSDFDKADIVMVDVGQGDCVHLKFRNRILIGKSGLELELPGCTDVMIDGGGSEEYNIGKKTVKPYLLKNGVRKIDLALATHLHTDHYKGIEELIHEGMVRQVLTEGKTGDVIQIGQDRIKIIWPDVRDPDADDENKNSLIFKAYINGITMLITGDIGEEGEHDLVERYRGTDVLDCDVLKVCHHGSKYSSTAEFIEAVSPVVALIGVGKNNTYGHPSDEAIERLEACGAIVFRTDRDGAIGVGGTKNGLEVYKMKR